LVQMSVVQGRPSSAHVDPVESAVKALVLTAG
jgi:hypothetical protein